MVVLRADNNEPAHGSAIEHVTPLKGDFFPRGGICRPVLVLLHDASTRALAGKALRPTRKPFEAQSGAGSAH